MKYCIDLNVTEDDSPSLIIKEALDSEVNSLSLMISDTNPAENCCLVGLFVPQNQKIEEVLEPKMFIKMLKKFLKDAKIDIELFQDGFIIANTILNSNDFDILNNIQNVIITPDIDTLNYLKANPSLLNKKLILGGVYSISHEDLDEIEKYFGDYSNILLQIDGNHNLVTISEYKKTVEAIDEIVSKIKKYPLSPLEQIMYAYDLVRDRVYHMEEENEDITKSRDLTSVLFGDKIVCVGYANIFEKVLNNLGIKAIMCSLRNVDPTKCGHRRNIVYVKDEKYEVEGIFYFDTTWDRKRNPTDISFLNSYRFFGRAKNDIELYTDSLIDRTFPGYNSGILWDFEEIVKNHGLKAVPKSMIETFNRISRFIDDKKLIDKILISDYPEDLIPDFMKVSFDLEEVMERLSEYERLFFEVKIKPETLLEVLYNVRKVEYYENPEKYPFSKESFKEAIINSDWAPVSKYEILLSVLKHKRVSSSKEELDSKASSFLEKYSEEKDLERKIEQVKLTRVLRRVYENKKELRAKM